MEFIGIWDLGFGVCEALGFGILRSIGIRWRLMSPTIFREGGFRFFFYSREETRMHVHAYCSEGEAKFWLVPEIELAKNYRMSRAQLKRAEEIIEAHLPEIKAAWEKHFGN